MNFTDLKKNLTGGTSAGIYIVEGEDSYLREKSENMISSTAVKDFPQLNLSYMDSGVSAEKIYESCMALPFMSDKRAVIVREYYPKAAEAQLLKKIDAPGTVLIINNRQKSEITKALSKIAETVDCSKQEAHVLTGWIATFLRPYKLTIDRQAAEMLAEYCGRDMARIDLEIKKLSGYSLGAVTAEDIENTVSKDAEYQVYMLSGYVTRGDGTKAYQMIADFARRGDTGYIQMFLSMLYNQYKRMYFVKTLRTTENEAAKMLGIKPYAVKMLKKDAAKLDESYLKRAISLISTAEYKIKSGKFNGDTALKTVIGGLLLPV